jgi:hypothetical protein
MDQVIRERLMEMSRLALEGKFGEDAQIAAREYQSVPSDMMVFVKVVQDFYTPRKTEEDNLLFQSVELFCRLIIVVYRDANKHDRGVAEALLYSFLKDYPGIANTNLYSRWESLIRATRAFKSASQTDMILAWEQTRNLVQAYNEFLNGLIGYLLINWRAVLQRNYSANTLRNNYGSKVREFMDLTGGEDGAFYLIGRIAKPDLRNAIAHGSIWLESQHAMVKYNDEQGNTNEISLVDFVGFAAVGSHIGQAYLAAIAAIIILTEGDPLYSQQIPHHIVQLFQHG